MREDSANPLLAFGEPLPHGFLLAGNKDRAKQDIATYLRIDGQTRRSGNVHYYDQSLLKIDRVREINTLVQKTSLGSGRSYFTIIFDHITDESQNALLKTLEEPPVGTCMFLVTEHADVLFDTVRSRLQRIEYEAPESAYDIEAYFSANYAERLAITEQFLADSKKKRLADRAGAGRFFKALARYYADHDRYEEYRNIEPFIEFIEDSSSSLKYITEYIAITAR